MNKTKILDNTRQFVKQELEKDSSGHDWWHIYRVTEMAKTIAKEEGADLFICELAALLHDIADDKFNDTKESGLKRVEGWLAGQGVEETIKNHIIEIISTMSYSGGHSPPMERLEGKVVQDADRLDALGAIGIARTFAYAGWKGESMYDPKIAVREDMSKEEYRKQKSTAINHFYEKLLKLKDLMNTSYVKQMAMKRHLFMEDYVKQFLLEWEAKDM